MKIESDLIRLRAVEKEDVPYIHLWNEQDSIENNDGCFAPIGKIDIENYVAHTSQGLFEFGHICLIIELKKKANKAIGYIEIFAFDPCHRHAEIGIIIDSHYRRNHYGVEALNLCTDYFLRTLDQKTLYARIAETNLPAIKLFTTCHFSYCGKLPNYIRYTHAYRDVMIYYKDLH